MFIVYVSFCVLNDWVQAVTVLAENSFTVSWFWKHPASSISSVSCESKSLSFTSTLSQNNLIKLCLFSVAQRQFSQSEIDPPSTTRATFRPFDIDLLILSVDLVEYAISYRSNTSTIQPKTSKTCYQGFKVNFCQISQTGLPFYNTHTISDHDWSMLFIWKKCERRAHLFL